MRQPEWGRERKKSGEHCASDRGGEQGATAKKKKLLEEETGRKNILEFEGKVCRTCCESREIIYSNKISKARHS